MLKQYHRQFFSIILAISIILIALFARSDSSRSVRHARFNDPHNASAFSSRIETARIVETFGKLPLSFEANQGQTGRATNFVARTGGHTIFLGPEAATLNLRTTAAETAHIRLKLAGDVRESSPEPADPLPGRSNYFIGNDPREWRTDIPTYSRIRYPEIYRGIDLIYYGNGRQLEYDFVVAPNERPDLISMTIEGADKIGTDQEGDLVIGLGNGQVGMRKPVVYQEAGGERHRIAANYEIDCGNLIRFRIGAYDHNLPLTIDPVVDYATFFGGSGADAGYGIALDAQSNVYITGQTSSLNFPLKNALDSTIEGANDAFVLKLNAQGNAIVFSTYIGGRNPGDKGWAIAVDRAGNVYFTGETNSLNFPTVNAAQPVFRGGVDGFVVKLNIQGNVLLYSTYLGGGFADVPYSIALDRFDNAYVTGRTESANFPVKNPLQEKLQGQRDIFITKLGADGDILYSTYLGGKPATADGRDEEAGYGIAVDAVQNIYVVGYTTSPNFPVANAIQPLFGGVEDAVVSKINAAGTGLIYSTYLGGTRADGGRGIAVDAIGNAYVTGYTLSLDFPRVEPLQPTYGGSSDGFVAKINAPGSELLYSTYLGGIGEENTGLIADITPACAIAVDSLGNAYVTGKTASANFPVVRAINQALRGDDDAYVAKIDPAGSELIYSTYLGSTFTGANGLEERGLGIAVTRFGTVFVTGQMLKGDYQTMQPVQTTYGGGPSDAFITKISSPDILGISAISAASFVGGSLAGESIVAAFGPNLASGIEAAKTTPLPTSLLGTSVIVKDKLDVERAAPLFFVSPDQVNFQIPPGVAPGKATITITDAQNSGISSTVLIEKVAPGLFSANANGQGLAAAVALRVKPDGSQIFEPVVQVGLFGEVVGVPIDLGPESDQVFLILFGTGWRNNDHLSNVSARIGDVDSQVTFAGPQGSFVGEDQINLQLSRSLAGRGQVAVNIIVDGRIANSVNVNIR